MATRYTVKNLETDLAIVNTKLEKIKHPYRLVVEQFNGSTWVYKATPEQVKNHSNTGSVKGGTPRACYQAACDYLIAYAL
jgi:hypothetical protein